MQNLQLYFSGDENCPVNLYKLYAEKRPEDMRDATSRFYICKNPVYGSDKPTGSLWYISIPMGKNPIGKFAKVMSTKAGLSGKHTNHSGRKTCVSKLLDANVPPTEVVQISGHKNLLSLNSYNTVSMKKQINMSNVLHKVSASGGSNGLSANIGGDSTPNVHDVVNDFQNGDDDDEELVAASQEIENALQSISAYEEIKESSYGQVVDLPLIHKYDGTLQVSRNKFNPESLFKNCTFNGTVNIALK